MHYKIERIDSQWQSLEKLNFVDYNAIYHVNKKNLQIQRTFQRKILLCNTEFLRFQSYPLPYSQGALLI